MRRAAVVLAESTQSRQKEMRRFPARFLTAWPLLLDCRLHCRPLFVTVPYPAGDSAVVSHVMPLFELMGKNIRHMGPAGAFNIINVVSALLAVSVSDGRGSSEAGKDRHGDAKSILLLRPWAWFGSPL